MVTAGKLPVYPHGAGYGYGDGYGYGYGDGDGAGYGYGDIVSCSTDRHTVTAAMLRLAQPCADQFATFKREFPNGFTWPDDIDKAAALELDVRWAASRLGFPLPTF